MNLSDGLETYLQSIQGVLAPATVVWYRRRLPSLLTFLGDMELSSITLDQLRAWRGSLASRTSRWGGGSSHPAVDGGLSAFTLHQYVRGAKRFFKFLEEEDRLQVSPARRLELPPLPKQYRRGLSTVDRDKILAVAEKAGPRELAICLFLADTACRVGGLAGLQVDDLDMEHYQAVLREKGRGGSGKARPVFYLERTRRALEAYLEIRPHVSHDRVLCNLQGAPLGPGGIYQVLKRLAKTAGVARGWNPHNWRHAAIRAMLANGMSLPAVSQIAGHSSVKTTGDIYGIFDERELAEMHARCSWIV